MNTSHCKLTELCNKVEYAANRLLMCDTDHVELIWWPQIKKELEIIDYEFGYWILPDETKEVIKDNLYIAEIKGETKSYKFLEKHLILTEKSLTIDAFIQLILNMKQWKRYPNEAIMSSTSYSLHKLGKINTFVSNEIISDISNSITDAMYNKIIKYLRITKIVGIMSEEDYLRLNQ